ncbi:glycosyl hydrolase family 43 protein [Paraphaeosphaeria sporulosa]
MRPNQSTCMRRLGDEKLYLTGPQRVFSQRDTPVQEGQNALYFDGKTYIGYSANFCLTTEYCIALLGNGYALMSGNGTFGTGLNGFFTSPNGNEAWVTFCATSNLQGACDSLRYAMVQLVTTNLDGTPDFGRPQGIRYRWPEPSG